MMNQSNTATATPFCNWCKISDSHWTDLCPVLAKMRCGKCGENGHIDRFCEINKLKREKQSKPRWSMPHTTEIEFCAAFYREKLAKSEPVDKYGYTESDRSNFGTQIYDIAQGMQEIPKKYATKLTWCILKKGKAQVIQFLKSPAIIEDLLLAGLDVLPDEQDEEEDEEDEEDEEEDEEEEDEEV